MVCCASAITNHFLSNKKKKKLIQIRGILFLPLMKDRIGFGATEGHSESSFWICFKKSFAPSHSGSNVVTYMFEVQNRRTEAARNIEWSSKGNSFKHCTPSVFPCRAKGLPFPRSLTWFPFPTGNTNTPHALFVFINIMVTFFCSFCVLLLWPRAKN